jgi:hypothetical protein
MSPYACEGGGWTVISLEMPMETTEAYAQVHRDMCTHFQDDQGPQIKKSQLMTLKVLANSWILYFHKFRALECLNKIQFS